METGDGGSGMGDGERDHRGEGEFLTINSWFVGFDARWKVNSELDKSKRFLVEGRKW